MLFGVSSTKKARRFGAGRFVRFSAISSPAGGLCLPAGKHTGILIYYQTIVNKKTTKKTFFFARSLPP